MTKKDMVLTGVEILLITTTLFFAIGYLVRHNVNVSSVIDQTAYIEPIKVYALSENPQFEIAPEAIGVNSKDIDVKVEHSTGAPVDVNVIKTKNDNGDYEVTLERSENFRPGKYMMIVTGDEASIYEDFYWGVLAVNTNKSVYMPNEEAFLQLGVLDQWGHTICGGNVKLEITDPNNKTKTVEVKNSPSCGRDNVVETADYYSYYKTGRVGTYTVALTNLDNNFVLATQFKVEENPMFSVERIGTTRINPFKADSYLMTIKVKAYQGFSGTVEEYTPKSFKIDGKEANKVSWDISLSAGEERVLTYRYTAPSLSPQFYLLGPLIILSNGTEVFRESRAWQIASDVVKTAAASGSWSTDATWGATSPPPVAGDTVSIGAYTITVGAGASAASINFTASAAKIEVRDTFTLQLSSALVLNNLANAAITGVLSGPGTINVPVVQVGNHTNPTTSTNARATKLIQQAAVLNATDLIINSESGTNLNTGTYYLSGGTANITRITNYNETTTTTSVFATNSAPQTGILNLSSGSPWLTAGAAGTVTRTLNGTTTVVNYNGSEAQAVLGGVTYRTLMVNNAAGATLGAAATTTTLTIGNYTGSSIFDDGGYQLTCAGTLNLTSGTFKLGGAAATVWPSFASNNISAGTTVEYKSAAAQTVSTTPTYSNLTFSGAGTKTTAAGTLNVVSSWSTSSTTALNTNNTIVSTSGNLNGTGNITQGSGSVNLNGDWLNTGTFTAGSASTIMTGTTKIISGPASGTTFHDLKVNNTVTNYAGTIAINSALSGSGTITQGSATTVNIKGDAIITGLIGSANSCSVNFSGTGNQSVTGSYSFYNVSFLTNSGSLSTIDVSLEYNLKNGGAGTTVNTTVTKPTNTVDGDFLLALIYIESPTIAADSPAGWTLINETMAGDSSFRNILYYKRASGEGASWTWTHSSAFTAAFVKRFTGVVASGDPEDTTRSTNSGNNNTPIWTGITTNTNGAALLGIEGFYNGTSRRSASTLTERIDDVDIFLQADLQATAGSTGNLTATDSDTGDQWVTQFIALKPATTGAGSARTITFTGNSITSVVSGGILTFKGASGAQLTLASSDANTWHLHVDPSATTSVSYVSPSKSDANGYKTIYATDGTSVDGGDNLNWIFSLVGNFNLDGVGLDGLGIK